MKYFKFIFANVLVLTLLVVPFFVKADQTVSTSQHIQISNPFKGGSDLSSLITALLQNVVMPIAAVVSVVFIILAGFKYVTAQGNPGEIKKANENLLWALIGTGVLLGAAGLSQVVQATVKQFINI